jgi:1-acyl-sn-glycerol-3-phosphate acyltransferase
MPQPQTIGEWKKYFDAAKADKKTRKEMAEELEIAVSAIDYHRGRIRNQEAKQLVKVPRIHVPQGGKTVVVFPSGIRTEISGVHGKEVIQWVADLK